MYNLLHILFCSYIFHNLIQYIYIIKMFTKIFLLIFLTTLSFSLKTQANLTTSFPIISHLYFTQNQIFYISRDRLSFGHIKKQNGSHASKYTLQNNQTLAGESEKNALIMNGSFMAQYSVFSNKVNISTPLEANVSDYRGFQSNKVGRYILADGQLHFKQLKSQTPDTFIIPISSQTTPEQTIQIENFDNRIIALSTSQNSICLNMIDYKNLTLRKCQQKKYQGKPRIQISSNYIYIHYKNGTQVFDQDFTIVENFQEQIKQLWAGSANLAGWRVFDVKSKIVKEGKLVIHNGIEGEHTLEKAENQYVIKSGADVLVKITNITSQPQGIWFNKKEGAYGKIHGRYELILQFANGRINFYELKAEYGKSAIINLQWSK